MNCHHEVSPQTVCRIEGLASGGQLKDGQRLSFAHLGRLIKIADYPSDRSLYLRPSFLYQASFNRGLPRLINLASSFKVMSSE